MEGNDVAVAPVTLDFRSQPVSKQAQSLPVAEGREGTQPVSLLRQRRFSF
jgi:hypothetical protein